MEEKIILYTSVNCSSCALAKAWLKKNKIEFITVDISKNVKSRYEIVEKTGQMGVPVLVRENILLGFSDKQYKAIL